MLFKTFLLVLILHVSEVIVQEDIPSVSPVLRTTKEDRTRFTFQGKRYYVGTVFQTHFYKALQFCRNQRMQLLSINSQEENDRIKKFLVDNGYKWNHFWTSGTNLPNLGLDDQFVWLSTGENLVYTNWHKEEPSGKGGSENKTENCIEIRSWLDYTWNDIRCEYPYGNFICESSIDC